MRTKPFRRALLAAVLIATIAGADVSDFEAKCAAGDASACTQAGDRLKATDPEKAAQLYERSCTLAVPTAGFDQCWQIESLARAAVTNGDEKRARELFTRACALKPQSCGTLGYVLDHGDSLPRDLAGAAQNHDKACAAGNVTSCATLSVMYAEGRGLAKNEAKANELRTKAIGLSRASVEREDANWATLVDKKSTRQELETKCRAAESSACMKLLWAIGRNDVAVEEVLVAGCAKSTEQCVALMSLGSGLLRSGGDTTRAVSAYEKACNAGYAGACAGLGYELMEGFHVPKSDAKSAALLERGCGGGNSPACRLWGEMLRDGRGAAKDEAKARAAIDKAVVIDREVQEKADATMAKVRADQDAHEALEKQIVPYRAELEALRAKQAEQRERDKRASEEFLRKLQAAYKGGDATAPHHDTNAAERAERRQKIQTMVGEVVTAP